MVNEAAPSICRRRHGIRVPEMRGNILRHLTKKWGQLRNPGLRILLYCTKLLTWRGTTDGPKLPEKVVIKKELPFGITVTWSLVMTGDSEIVECAECTERIDEAQARLHPQPKKIPHMILHCWVSSLISYSQVIHALKQECREHAVKAVVYHFALKFMQLNYNAADLRTEDVVIFPNGRWDFPKKTDLWNKNGNLTKENGNTVPGNL